MHRYDICVLWVHPLFLQPYLLLSWMFEHDCVDTCCFGCLLCMCFGFLYLHLLSATEHVSHGKSRLKYAYYVFYYYHYNYYYYYFYYYYHYHHKHHHHHYDYYLEIDHYERVVDVSCLLAAPAAFVCSSGTVLFRQLYTLPHWGKKLQIKSCYLLKSQSLDTGPTSPSTDPITPAF